MKFKITTVDITMRNEQTEEHEDMKILDDSKEHEITEVEDSANKEKSAKEDTSKLEDDTTAIQGKLVLMEQENNEACENR